jgi:hypothetical protein
MMHLSTFAQSTAFTYQGTIDDGGQPANGSYDFEFALFDAAEAGTQLGSPVTINGVIVAEGSFTLNLDFGAEFPGDARWLEIRVKQAAASSGSEAIGTFTVLTPRQQIASSPYAIKSLLATNADMATNALQLDGTDADQYVLTTDTRMTDERAPASGSNNYIQNTTTPQAMSSFNISGIGKATILDVSTQYNIGGNRILSNPGFENLFAGVEAGANTTGGGNSFFGQSAGAANTTSEHNSFFGRRAGAANTTGGGNSFFGSNAGQNQLNGFSNSFFGASAGDSNTTGGNNTSLGAFSDVGSGNLTYATAIGAGTIVSNSNTIQLGRTNGTDKVLAPGSAIQPANRSGWAKALLRVSSSGNVLSCYNGVTGSSSAGCGFTVQRSQLGAYGIDFGFNVASRFIVATPIYNGAFPAVLEIAFLPNAPNLAIVNIKDALTTIPADTAFMVVVF